MNAIAYYERLNRFLDTASATQLASVTPPRLISLGRKRWELRWPATITEEILRSASYDALVNHAGIAFSEDNAVAGGIAVIQEQDETLALEYQTMLYMRTGDSGLRDYVRFDYHPDKSGDYLNHPLFHVNGSTSEAPRMYARGSGPLGFAEWVLRNFYFDRIWNRLFPNIYAELINWKRLNPDATLCHFDDLCAHIHENAINEWERLRETHWSCTGKETSFPDVFAV